MKQHIVGVFNTREDAEKAINAIHRDLDVGTDEISYIYRNTDGDITEFDASRVSSMTPKEAAGEGAKIGGTAGALAGLAAVVGVIPVIGPIFAAGPIVAGLGITGAAGTIAAGGAAGTVVGGLIGWLVGLGVNEERAQQYSDRVRDGDVLVTVHEEEADKVTDVMEKHGASDVDVYMVTV